MADGGPAPANLPLVARIVHVNVVGDRYALRTGDRLFADGTVLLGRRGRRIGLAASAGPITRTGRRGDGRCPATLPLPLGRITGAWPLTRSQARRTRPITGGSGLYRGASGRFLLGPT